jgi:hypothetical protein
MIKLQGSIYNELRSKMLSFYPEGDYTKHKNRQLFNDWIKHGYYTPLSCTKQTGADFEATKLDIAITILNECELLYNACIEHLLELNQIVRNNQLHSDAWNVVTMYYFAFYAAQSFNKLIGNPIFFLDSASLSNFASGLGGGTFELSWDEDISLTQTKYCLHKIKRRLHDAVWHQTFSQIETLTKKYPLDKCPNELNLFSNITDKRLHKTYGNYSWPSEIRNKANYIPGFAYTLVEDKTICNSFKCISNFIKNEQKIDNKLQDSFDNCCESLEVSFFRGHVSALFHMGMGIFYIVQNLYDDILERRKLDRRMQDKRKAFISKYQRDYNFLGLYS